MGLRPGKGPCWAKEEIKFERGCDGKEAFDSESGATAALRLYERLRHLRSGDGMTPYQCEFCGKWHLGHSVRPVRRRKRKGGAGRKQAG